MAKLFIDRCEIASRSTWFYALMSKAPVEIYEFNERNEELEMENPMRIVPFLMDSDVKLWGSQACILYMAEKYGNFEGFGKSHDERARLESLLSWASNSLLRNVAQDYVVPKLYEEEGLDGKSKEVLIENGELSVNKQLDVIESMYLKKSKYLSGDEVNFVDFYIGIILSVLDKVKFDFSKWPLTLKWYSSMKEKVSSMIEKFQEV